jgi:hypothetical protein
MTTFLFSYRMPKNYQPRRAERVAAWSAWFDSLGANLVDRGNPIFESTTVGNGAADTALGGYSLVTADDMAAAVALANGCPGLADGAGVEVGVVTELNRDAE